MKNKLIIIEGLPGTGKTTTAKMTKEILDKNSIKNELYLEGNLNHPADYDRVAYFNENEYKTLLNENQNNNKLIKEISINNDVGHFIKYYQNKIKLKEKFPDTLYNEILKRDIYELPLDLNKKLIINKWDEFNKKRDKDSVYIFECCFIQNPVTVSLIRDNAEINITVDYVLKLLEKINKLNPILIYLYQNDIDLFFKKAIKERPKEWLDGFINYYTEQGYGKENNLSGLNGTIEVLKKRKEIEEIIYNRLDMKKYKINSFKNDKEQVKEKIKNLIYKTRCS